MAPEHKGSDGGNLEMSKRSQKLLHWSEKVKILNKERKSLYAEVAKIYGKNESSICEIVKKENENLC